MTDVATGNLCLGSEGQVVGGWLSQVNRNAGVLHAYDGTPMTELERLMGAELPAVRKELFFADEYRKRVLRTSIQAIIDTFPSNIAEPQIRTAGTTKRRELKSSASLPGLLGDEEAVFTVREERVFDTHKSKLSFSLPFPKRKTEEVCIDSSYAVRTEYGTGADERWTDHHGVEAVLLDLEPVVYAVGARFRDGAVHIGETVVLDLFELSDDGCR